MSNLDISKLSITSSTSSTPSEAGTNTNGTNGTNGPNGNGTDTSNGGGYLFRAKTKEAFVIKVLSELLANASIQFAPFRIDNEGIHLNATDRLSHQLINFTLHRDKFFNWKNRNTIAFTVNSTHLHRLLKSVKKKDMITMYIKENDDCRLCFSVETADENDVTNTSIRIIYIQYTRVAMPEGYPHPTICSAKEFQKMKNLHNISQEMKVTCPYPGLIKFFCDGGEIYAREVVLGNEADEEDKRENSFEEFQETFKTSYITHLTKCANQSGNVQIFVKNGSPLKIKMDAGKLGELTVLIKSNERIKLEQKLAAEKKKDMEQEAEQAD
jgi:proliferating cell nuclear antigen PCNA